MIGPLWGEKDEAKRIAGWKAVDKYIAEKGYVIPLRAILAADRLQGVLKVTAERDRRAAADAGRPRPDLSEGARDASAFAPLVASRRAAHR